MTHELGHTKAQASAAEQEAERINTGVCAGDLEAHPELESVAPVFREIARHDTRPRPNWQVLTDHLRAELVQPAPRTLAMRYRTLRDSLKATDSVMLRAGAVLIAVGLTLLALVLLWFVSATVAGQGGDTVAAAGVAFHLLP